MFQNWHPSILIFKKNYVKMLKYHFGIMEQEQFLMYQLTQCHPIDINSSKKT